MGNFVGRTSLPLPEGDVVWERIQRQNLTGYREATPYPHRVCLGHFPGVWFPERLEFY